MTRTRLRSVAIVAAVLAAGVLATPPPASAAPSCIAQSTRTEHELYGTAWGHDLIAFLASNPEVLDEFGFHSFGELARFAARQDPEACPPDL